MNRIQTCSMLALAVASVSTAAFGQVLHVGAPGAFGTPYATLGTAGANTWEMYAKYNSWNDGLLPHITGTNVTGNNTQAAIGNAYLGQDGGALFGANGIVVLSNTVAPTYASGFQNTGVFYLKDSIADDVSKWGVTGNSWDMNGHQTFDVRIGFVNDGAGYVTGGPAKMDPGEAINTTGVFFHVTAANTGATVLGQPGNAWTFTKGNDGANTGFNFLASTGAVQSGDAAHTLSFTTINGGTTPTDTGVAYGSALELSAKLVPDTVTIGNYLLQVKSGSQITSVSFNPADTRFGGTFNPATAKPIIYAGPNWGGASTATMHVGVFAKGDANADGKVNLVDVNVARTNYGGADKTWSHGDFTQDGRVNLADVNVLRTNFNQPVSGPIVAAGEMLIQEAPADGKLDLIVDLLTGNIQITGGTGASLSMYEVASASGALDASKWASLTSKGTAGWSTFSNGDTSISEVTFGTGPVLGGTSLDIGAVFRVGAAQDLTFMAFDNIGNQVEGTISYVAVPEPTSIGFLAMGAMTLIARRRRSR